MTSTQNRQFPIVLRRVQYAVAVVAAIHVVALLLILLHRDVISAAVAARNPGGDVDKLTSDAVLQGVIPHVVLAVVLPLRALRLRDGRGSARTWLTVLLAIQLLAHASLPIVLAELPGYGPWVIGVQTFSLLFEVTALWLLWTPQARRFFAPTESARHEPVAAPTPRR
jgi:hypothetical protein